jgi:hypothetical protein
MSIGISTRKLYDRIIVETLVKNRLVDIDISLLAVEGATDNSPKYVLLNSSLLIAFV